MIVMIDLFTFRLHTKEEMPEGQVEDVGIVAASPSEALSLLSHLPGSWKILETFKVENPKTLNSYLAQGPCFLYQQEAPFRSPMRCANDLFTMTPKKVTSGACHIIPYLHELREFDFDHLEDIIDVELRTLAEGGGWEYYTGVLTLWYLGQPVAVCRYWGDENSTHVVSEERYKRLVNYVYSLRKPLEINPATIDPDEPLRFLTFIDEDMGI